MIIYVHNDASNPFFLQKPETTGMQESFRGDTDKNIIQWNHSKPQTSLGLQHSQLKGGFNLKVSLI